MLYLEARLGGKVARWPLVGDEFVIGRGEEADIRLEDDSVSRRHVRVAIRGTRVGLEDLGSTNGLRVDGARVERGEVGINQWFVVGTVLMAVRQGVSLTSRSDGARPMAEPAGSSAPRGPDSPPTGAGSTAGHGGNARFLASLTRRIEAADGADQLLQGLLDQLVESTGARGAAMIERVGNGWVLRGQTGQPLTEDQETAFLDAAATSRGSREPLIQDAVVGWSLAGAGRADGAWLLAHSAPSWRGGRPEAALVASLCAKWMETLTDGASVAGAAPPSAEEGDDGVSFIAVSESCRAMLDELDLLGATNIPVLLHGESGTGKELLSKRLHERSPRREGPFVAVNCAALPRDLLEAELFGIEKGVATGVAARPGHFVLASGGTLHLDEIGDMPLELQPKVLRAIESGEVKSLGAPAPVTVDVRIVASTHQDLEAMVGDGTFRRDLFHRVAGAVVRVPALRERPEDILPLARAFVREVSRDQGRSCAGFDLQAARQLIGYDWAGNVRELRHLVSRAVALADGPVLHAALFPEAIREQSDGEKADAYLGLAGEFREARRAFERLYFSQLLARCDHNLSKASRLANLNRSHLYKKLAELGLK